VFEVALVAAHLISGLYTLNPVAPQDKEFGEFGAGKSGGAGNSDVNTYCNNLQADRDDVTLCFLLTARLAAYSSGSAAMGGNLGGKPGRVRLTELA
jgi:hypothetical protein